MILLACILHLSASFMAVNVGLYGISNSVYPRHNLAVDEYLVHATDKYTEEALYNNLDTLLSSQLNRGFMETHEDCLVRGLRKAFYSPLSLGLQYPDIRVQVMDWATENCGRLQYTPQVVFQDPTPQQAVLTYWVDASYRSRCMLEGALGAVRQQACRFWNRLLSAFTDTQTSSITEHVPVSANTSGTLPPSRALPKVPFGFALRCEPTEPCRLVYPSGSSKRPDKVHISREALAKLKRQIKELRAFDSYVKKAQWATERLMFLLDTIYISLSMALFASIMIVTPSSTSIEKMVGPPCPSRKTKQIKFRVTSHHLCFVGRLLNTLFHMYPVHLQYGDLREVSFSSYFLVVGIAMLVQYFTAPSPRRFENVNLAYNQIKELYFIAQGWEVPSGALLNMLTYYGYHVQAEDPKPKPIKPEPTEDLDTNIENMLPSSGRHQQADQSHEPHIRRASWTTTTQEDIEASSRQLLHKLGIQQAVHSDLETVSDTDSETESEADHGSFVDLAGGVTPQVSDAESGWSIVDA